MTEIYVPVALNLTYGFTISLEVVRWLTRNDVFQTSYWYSNRRILTIDTNIVEKFNRDFDM